MLWYKAWLETRSRFLTCLATLTIFCAVFVGHAQGLIRPEWKTDYNRLLFVTQQFMVIMWILAVVLLGMGGIVRERAIGTSSLTLSLPVSRARLLGIRIGMGVLEAIALAVVPWTTIFLVSSFSRMPILITQVGFYVLLLIGGGSAYFAMAVLVSSFVRRLPNTERRIEPRHCAAASRTFFDVVSMVCMRVDLMASNSP